MDHTPARRIVVGGAAALLVAVCAIALSWWVGGGRWYAVATPSMGKAAPVGTLLLTRPASVDGVQVGDIVTFHPPGTHEVYSHRVVGRSEKSLRTKGDLNALADPWSITDRDLIGTVVTRWWGMGWVLRGLPLFLLGLAVTAAFSLCLRPRWRAPARLIGVCASVSLVCWVLRPWIGLVRLTVTPANPGVVVRAVSTGVFPTRAAAFRDGNQVRLLDGQVGAVHVLRPDGHGRYLVDATPSLTLWWWVAVILVCAAPLLWTLIVGFPALDVVAEAGPAERDEPEAAADDGLGLVVSERRTGS